MESERAAAERRRTPRYLVRLPVELCQSDRSEFGSIVDISLCGAQVQCMLLSLDVSQPISVRLACFREREPIEISARFVRATSSGIAVEYMEVDGVLRALLKLAALSVQSGEPVDSERSRRRLELERQIREL